MTRLIGLHELQNLCEIIDGGYKMACQQMEAPDVLMVLFLMKSCGL